MQAINDGNVHLLRDLAAKSVPLETKNPFGHTPLAAACFKRNADVVESLIRLSIRMKTRDADILSLRSEMIYLIKSGSESEDVMLRCQVTSGACRVFG